VLGSGNTVCSEALQIAMGATSLRVGHWVWPFAQAMTAPGHRCSPSRLSAGVLRGPAAVRRPRGSGVTKVGAGEVAGVPALSPQFRGHL